MSVLRVLSRVIILLITIGVFYSTPAFAALNNAPLNPMNNPGALNNGLIHEAQVAITELDYDDLNHLPGTIINPSPNHPNIRIDAQNPPPNAHNIQIQRGGNTIAGVIIDNQYLPANIRPGMREEVLRVVRAALVNSLDSLRAGHPQMFQISGSFSN
ncbi:hypothetical protein NIES4073_77560 [Kalymmatonema gypsitolerans NIES-4073]|nr:hypothetical protein NIES4073_77560 [Scytonema sp. NIES-4073]